MAKNCCGQETCSCLIQGGDGIIVVGSGTQADPFAISLDMSVFSPTLTVQDTTSVNLTLSGAGTPSSPYILRADAAVAVSGLTDVDHTTPNAGDVLSWNTGEQLWVPGPVPVSPPGAVNVGDGLGGTGAVATPLFVEVSGTWGTPPLTGDDSTVGLEIYVDTNGELRAQPVAALDWDSITGKPATFPPSPHTHVAADITNPQALMVGGVNVTNSDTATGGNIFRVAHAEDLSWVNGTVWFAY